MKAGVSSPCTVSHPVSCRERELCGLVLSRRETTETEEKPFKQFKEAITP